MLKSSKESLAVILGGREGGKLGKDLFSFSHAPEESFVEVFRSDKVAENETPLVVVVDQDEIENFFVSINTFHSEKAPITALIHVLDDESRVLLDQKPKAQNSRSIKSSLIFRKASIGLAIGEAALAAAAANESDSTVQYAACKRTLSFSLGRGATLFGSRLNSHVVSERWMRLRKATGLPVSEMGADVLTMMHNLISGTFGDKNSINILDDLAVQLSAVGSTLSWTEDSILPALRNYYPAMAAYDEGLQGAFDTRILSFNKFVEAIKNNSQGVRNDEIAIACACNRILPGSFAHVAVLLKLVEIYPFAIFWYGMFSALNNFSNSKSINAGLIAKLERDFVEPFSFEQRPRCDISLQEFEVISRIPLSIEILKPSQQRAILVSIYPGIDIYTRLAVESDGRFSRSKKDADLEEMHRRVERLLDEAAFLVRSVRDSGRGHTKGKRPSGDGY